LKYPFFNYSVLVEICDYSKSELTTSSRPSILIVTPFSLNEKELDWYGAPWMSVVRQKYKDHSKEGYK
jgi:hypothetical protein